MNKYTIPNLKNACKLLKILGNDLEQLSVSEASKILQIPRTSCLRIMTTLEEEKILEKIGKNYRLGTSVIPLGVNTLERSELRNLASPLVKQLSLDTGESAHLAIPADHKSLIIFIQQSIRPMQMAAVTGTLIDLHCSSHGKIFLAYLIENPKEYMRGIELTRRTDKTYTDIDSMKDELQRIREQGYSIDDEEFKKGVKCAAAPIFDPEGKVIGAVGITAPMTRLKGTIFEDHIKKVQKTATLISELL